MPITYRKDLDRPLTADEVDENFKILEEKSSSLSIAIHKRLKKTNDRTVVVHGVKFEDLEGHETRIGLTVSYLSTSSTQLKSSYTIVDMIRDDKGTITDIEFPDGSYHVGCELKPHIFDVGINFSLTALDGDDENYPDVEFIAGTVTAYII